ncbi:hypothetical protein [Fibrobacter sp. UWH1]|uniref:hypothetical protein n=1 Tax=Fibrobacter sp. UWH1 TaxID=1964354 RepID=UPI000B51EC45|nr:hypothetical protein [Fibrobacter sp. UWH1]OWV06232.1 hypothetical protein B7992_15050 [Fibrobacter sp. UWH1]
MDCNCISAICDIVLATTAVVSAIFAFYQWNKSVKVNSSMANYDIIKDLYSDHLMNLLYEIDRETEFKKVEFGTGREKLVDKLLAKMEHVCWMLNQGIIKEKNNNVLIYWLNRICANKEIQEYLSNVKAEVEKQGHKTPYQNLENRIYKKER